MNLSLLPSLLIRFIFLFVCYYQTLGAVEFTKNEKQWIASHPIVHLGADYSWAPYDFVDKKGKHVGIAADILALVSQKTGLSFDVKTGVWSDILQQMKEEKFDGLSCAVSTEKRKQYLYFTPPYMDLPLVIVVQDKRNDIKSITDLNGKLLAVNKGSYLHEWLVEKYPKIKLKLMTSNDAALEEVAYSRVDAYIGNLAVATYIIKTHYLSNVKIVGAVDYMSTNVSIAIAKKNKILQHIIAKALQNISPAEKKKIEDKWIDFKFEKIVDYALVYQLLGLFLFFILGTWLWYRKVRQEISKRKASEAQMGMLIDNIPLNVIVSDYEGNVLRANTFALETFGVSEEEIYKYNVQNFYADDTERESLMQEIRSKGKVTNSIVKFRRLDEKEMDVLMSIIPIRYDEKNALLSIMVDMSERIEMEEDLREAKKIAERANKSKSEFLANMSHEIRTPMNAIMGFTDLLDEQIQDTRLKSYTKTIKNAGQTLLTLINDILDLSKIEAGKLEIHRTAVNVHDIVEDVASMFSLTASAKGLSIVIEVDDEIPASLLIDGIRLRQVLVNLVGNAVKFTDEGYIKLCIHAFNVDEHLSKLDLEICVEDTGVGIAKDQRERIFNSFEQQEGQDNRKFGGTGLGLSISKRLVEMMDGSIMVQSEEDRGATFFIYLYGVDISSTHPLEEHTSLAADEHICFAKAKILVVDDIADNRALILHIFEGSKIEIVTASNGKEAIAQYQKEKPDLILMDIRMPVMDGYAATSKIKKLGDVPIIALTASVMQDEYEQEKSKEFDGYLRKPILKKDLFLALSHFLAYETVIESKEVAKNEAIVLESIPKKEREVLKMYLKTKVEPSYLVAVRSNNISEIEHFNDALEQLSKIYKIERLESYCAELKHAIEVFDIVQIQILLKAYKTLISKF